MQKTFSLVSTLLTILLTLYALTASAFAAPETKASADIKAKAAQSPIVQNPLTTEEIDARARDIGRSLRCVVCQNQSIDESDAPLAADMRKIVRSRLEKGQSKAEIIAYMRQNYGDFVLLKPPVQKNTLLLWGLPFLVLIITLFWFFRPVHKPTIKQNETRQ